ncbi:hypothetical protein HPP92_009292 [Vanilla planifolia]|uniref:Uncharacterized protein n=1 Tax=Vanilla planifolia TaxID=51239 RepID=A0A835V5A5_VANPL|nr:hypothetical protein HPP92_009292 [Vanilla planifolia]
MELESNCFPKFRNPGTIVEESVEYALCSFTNGSRHHKTRRWRCPFSAIAKKNDAHQPSNRIFQYWPDLKCRFGPVYERFRIVNHVLLVYDYREMDLAVNVGIL